MCCQLFSKYILLNLLEEKKNFKFLQTFNRIRPEFFINLKIY